MLKPSEEATFKSALADLIEHQLLADVRAMAQRIMECETEEGIATVIRAALDDALEELSNIDPLAYLDKKPTA